VVLEFLSFIQILQNSFNIFFIEFIEKVLILIKRVNEGVTDTKYEIEKSFLVIVSVS